MVKIVWDTWTLKELKNKLHINNLSDFLSLSKKLKLQKEKLIEKWKEECREELRDLKTIIEISKNELEDYLYNHLEEWFFSKIRSLFVIYNKGRKIWKLNKNIQRLEKYFEEYSIQKVERQINNVVSEEHLIQSLKSVYYWAVWEEAVVDEFKHMYFPWILINDFKQRFNKPIFTKWGHDIIQSIQIDHIFISDKGIFLIETKNRSKESKERFTFWPVKQVERSWHAFYIYLRKIFANDKYLRNQKIPTVFKLVVFMWWNKIQSNNPYIRVLYLQELKRFIATRISKIKPDEYNYIWDILVEENEV
jgi:hypothetical protein